MSWGQKVDWITDQNGNLAPFLFGVPINSVTLQSGFSWASPVVTGALTFGAGGPTISSPVANSLSFNPALFLVGTASNFNGTLAQFNGTISVINIGSGYRVAEGSNAKQGTATLSSGSVVVANTSVTNNSRIFLTAQDNNTAGSLRVSARTAGTSFTITSSGGTDSGVVAYEIFEPS